MTQGIEQAILAVEGAYVPDKEATETLFECAITPAEHELFLRFFYKARLDLVYALGEKKVVEGASTLAPSGLGQGHVEALCTPYLMHDVFHLLAQMAQGKRRLPAFINPIQTQASPELIRFFGGTQFWSHLQLESLEEEAWTALFPANESSAGLRELRSFIPFLLSAEVSYMRDFSLMRDSRFFAGELGKAREPAQLHRLLAFAYGYNTVKGFYTSNSRRNPHTPRICDLFEANWAMWNPVALDQVTSDLAQKWGVAPHAPGKAVFEYAKDLIERSTYLEEEAWYWTEE